MHQQKHWVEPKCIILAFALVLMNSNAAAGLVTFEELSTFTATGPSGSYYNGNPSLTNVSNSLGWSSGGVYFSNSYTNLGAFDFWDGWSYSNVQDAATAGFGNQYASAPGGGATSSQGVDLGGKYAVGSSNGYFNLPDGALLQSVDLTNATYAAISMRDGDPPPFIFAKKFVAGDFFNVTLNGYDSLNATGNLVGSRTVALADFTNGNDLILTNWLNVDLTSIATAKSVSFAFASSDVGPFGINTPTYLAIDNLNFSTAAVPEPETWLLLSVSGFVVLFSRRCRKATGQRHFGIKSFGLLGKSAGTR